MNRPPAWPAERPWEAMTRERFEQFLFGIRDAATAKTLAQVADAVVIGSRIIQEIENTPKEGAAEAVRAFVAGIRSALDA